MKQQILILLLIALCSTLAFAQIPRTLSYQGVLTDAVGNPRQDSTYHFTFSLYDSGSGGVQLWSEPKPLQTKRGLFSTALGDVTPFPDSLKFDRPYWLNIHVDGIGELSPRIPLTSVGYSMNALRADTAKVSFSTIVGWHSNGPNLYYMDGNIGIGDPNPMRKIQIPGIGIESRTISPDAGAIRFGDGSGWRIHLGKSVTRDGQHLYSGSDGALITIRDNGNVGFGTIDPLRKIQIDGVPGGVGFEGFVASPNSGAIRFGDNTGWKFHIGRQEEAPLAPMNEGTAGAILTVVDQGRIGINTTSPMATLDVVGTTKTSVLEITGGSDLAEPFEMSNKEQLLPGTLVVIDKNNPGKLKQSTGPYDKRVAGIISGAGGINPGLTLNQEGKLPGGQHVALSGQVYAFVSTVNGAIEPGDLLTTSNIPGYGMKATDETKSHGTIIGKAMSSLKEGEGLVLVLVNLQ